MARRFPRRPGWWLHRGDRDAAPLHGGRMSEESTVVDTRTFHYIAERTTAEDPFLAELKQAAREAELPAIWIAPEQIAFLQILLRAANARRVVEVGTLAGVSAIGMARALPPDGRVDTIEL